MSDGLVQALQTTYEINCHVRSQLAIEATVQRATDFFIHKNTVPHIRRWGIVAVDIPTTGTLLYNINHKFIKKTLGLVTLPTLEPYIFDDVLWVIECDKYTPRYIWDMAHAHTNGGLGGQIINLVHTSLTD